MPITYSFTDRNGLRRHQVANEHCEASFFEQGSHVINWQPCEQSQPVFFRSSKGLREVGKPFREGPPVLWPIFGPDPAGVMPLHGIARILPWQLEEQRETEDGATEVVMSLSSDEQTRKLFPHDFKLVLVMKFGQSLTMSLRTYNLNPQGLDAFPLANGFHPYFYVFNSGQVVLKGLAGKPYLNRARGQRIPCMPTGTDLKINEEVDSLYDHSGEVSIEDPGFGRRIIVSGTGYSKVNVWNPWSTKILTDLGLKDFWSFVCAEPVNAEDGIVMLRPQASNDLTMVVRVERM